MPPDSHQLLHNLNLKITKFLDPYNELVYYAKSISDAFNLFENNKWCE